MRESTRELHIPSDEKRNWDKFFERNKVDAEQLRKTDPARAEYHEAIATKIEISSLLSGLRKEAGLTQEEVASRLKSSQAQVARMERLGYTGTLKKILEYVGVCNADLELSIRSRQSHSQKPQVTQGISPSGQASTFGTVKEFVSAIRGRLGDSLSLHTDNRDFVIIESPRATSSLKVACKLKGGTQHFEPVSRPKSHSQPVASGLRLSNSNKIVCYKVVAVSNKKQTWIGLGEKPGRADACPPRSDAKAATKVKGSRRVNVKLNLRDG